MSRSCVLIREGGGDAEISHFANALAAYLELPSEFAMQAYGDPCDVKVIHSGSITAMSEAISKVLTAAKCTVTVEVNQTAVDGAADPAAAVSLVANETAPLLILMSSTPLLSHLESKLTAGMTDAHPNPNAPTDVEKQRFMPCSGVLLVETSEKDKWVLQHVIKPSKNWWIAGSSQYESGEPE